MHLDVHVKRAHSDEILSVNCHLCNKTLSDAKSLKTHILNVHEGLKKGKCDLCGGVFLRLDKHIRRVHSDKSLSVNCHLCNKTLSDVSKLKRHILAVHEGFKKYNCNFCAERFAAKTSLNNHIRKVHTIY